jgi:hypothetical protein
MGSDESGGHCDAEEESRSRVPRGLKSARQVKNNGLYGTTEVVP